MKRKYREAMRAAARQMHERADDDEDDAIDARDWHDEWAMSAVLTQQDESNNNQRSQE
jgi:hypothetical protein